MTAKKKHLTIRKTNRFGHPYVLARHEISPIVLEGNTYHEAHFACHSTTGEVTLRRGNCASAAPYMTAHFMNERYGISAEFSQDEIVLRIACIVEDLNESKIPEGLNFKQTQCGVLV